MHALQPLFDARQPKLTSFDIREGSNYKYLNYYVGIQVPDGIDELTAKIVNRNRIIAAVNAGVNVILPTVDSEDVAINDGQCAYSWALFLFVGFDDLYNKPCVWGVMAIGGDQTRTTGAWKIDLPQLELPMIVF